MASKRVRLISDEAAFTAAINNSSVPVVVDLFAVWCSPCKAIAPVIEQIATELADSVDVYKVDVDEVPSIAQNLGVRSIPTLVFYRNGKVVEKLVGSRSRSEYIAAIERARTAAV
ncbi:MAG: thioredoxin [Puniceicoccales bacterium]|jgi:thioredoxin 1|nr:thioredoxin [Puniceicoccales bacterium]